MTRRVALAPALIAALLASAGTCDNQDLSGRFVLELDAGDAQVVQAFSQPYIGRLTLDYGLRNTGTSAGAYEISVQAQTAGAEDGRACDNGLSATPRVLDAATLADATAADPSRVPTLRDESRSHFVSVPDGQSAGLINVRIRRTSTYRIFVSGAADSIVLIGTDGAEILPNAEIAADSCELFTQALEYELTDGTYGLRVSEDGLVLLLEQACSNVRTVPRTCPGAVSDVFAADPLGLESGAFVSGRIPSTNLGVGNQAVVGLACHASTPDCSGELEVFFLVQQLECRRDTDCSNVEACTDDGYCRRVRDRGCSAGANPASDWLAWLPLLLLLRRRR